VVKAIEKSTDRKSEKGEEEEEQLRKKSKKGEPYLGEGDQAAIKEETSP